MDTTLVAPSVSPVKAQAMSCLAAVAESMRMSPDERQHFMAHPVAMSIAIAPQVTGCSDPIRSSIAMLTLYVAANRGGVRKAFDHSPADNQGSHRFAIAEALMTAGDAQVKRAFIARWELVTIFGHDRDRQKDSISREYNPLLSGGWALTEKVSELEPDALFGILPELDSILPRHLIPVMIW